MTLSGCRRSNSFALRKSLFDHRLQVWFYYLGKPRLHVYDRSILIEHANLDRVFENVSNLHGQVAPSCIRPAYSDRSRTAFTQRWSVSRSDKPGPSRSRHSLACLLTFEKIVHCGRRLAASNSCREAFDSCLDRCPKWHVFPRTDQLLLQANGPR